MYSFIKRPSFCEWTINAVRQSKLREYESILNDVDRKACLGCVQSCRIEVVDATSARQWVNNSHHKDENLWLLRAVVFRKGVFAANYIAWDFSIRSTEGNIHRWTCTIRRRRVSYPVSQMNKDSKTLNAWNFREPVRALTIERINTMTTIMMWLFLSILSPVNGN